jgi:hypothetical protein
METLLFFTSLLVISSVVGWMIGNSRGRPGAGFLCGFLLGPLGCGVAFFLPREQATPKTGAGRQDGYQPLRGDPMEEWEMQQRVAQGPLPPPAKKE